MKKVCKLIFFLLLVLAFFPKVIFAQPAIDVSPKNIDIE